MITTKADHFLINLARKVLDFTFVLPIPKIDIATSKTQPLSNWHYQNYHQVSRLSDAGKKPINFQFHIGFLIKKKCIPISLLLKPWGYYCLWNMNHVCCAVLLLSLVWTLFSQPCMSPDLHVNRLHAVCFLGSFARGIWSHSGRGRGRKTGTFIFILLY